MPLALVIPKKISLFHYFQKIKPVIPLFLAKIFVILILLFLFSPRVSNRLNARQSKNFQQISPESLSAKPHETIICLFRNVKRFQKLFGLRLMGYFRAGIYYDLDRQGILIFRLACSDPQSESVTE